MKYVDFDIHGVRFAVADQKPCFITRGAIQDLNCGLDNGWRSQIPAFHRFSEEIEKFALELHRRGIVQNGVAVIGPEHVQIA